MSFEKEKKEIIYWGKALNQKGFVTAKNGNISSKVDEDKVLITAHDAYLGHLEEKEILLSDLAGNILEGNLNLTTEKNLHLSTHNKFKDIKVVIHSHPAYVTAFFHYFKKLEIFSFEAKLYLGDIKAIAQITPAVTDVEPVLAALENSNVVVLENHGAVSMGRDFKEAFSLIELLDEQAKVNFAAKSARLSKDSAVLATPDAPKKEEAAHKKKYKLLSKEHIQKLSELVNNDQEAQSLGKKYDLTCTLAVKNQDTQEAACFYYEHGKIVKTDNRDTAEFVIIGKEEILKKVFNKEIDPFVASTQGKVTTKGDFAKMSKWYPVLVRTFKLWEQAPVI